MPTFTQTAFAAELAAERCDALASMHRLMASLEGQSTAVVTGAIGGMVAEAQAERDRLRAEAEAEAAEVAARKAAPAPTGRRRRGAAAEQPALESAPEVERHTPDQPASGL